VKRLVMLGLVVATAAVAYAAAGERLGLEGLLSRFRSDLPTIRSEELPFVYPAHLWRDNIEGEVILRIHITAAGTVDSVEMERSSDNEELDDIALRGAKQLQFHPARQGDENVDVWAMLPVRFQKGSVTTKSEGRQ